MSTNKKETLGTESFNFMKKYLREENIFECLLSNETTYYLNKAFYTCERYFKRNREGFTCVDKLYSTVDEITRISNLKKLSLNPNNHHVMHYVQNGDTLYTIWSRMNILYRDEIRYMGDASTKLIPEVSSFENVFKRDTFEGLWNTWNLKADKQTLDFLMKTSWYGDEYEILLNTFIGLLKYTPREAVIMLDVFQDKLLTYTVRSVYMYLVDVISTYHWCFIRRIKTDYLENLFARYRDTLIPLLESAVMVFMFYSDEERVPTEINKSELARYTMQHAEMYKSSEEYDKMLLYIDATVKEGEDPTVISKDREPILSNESYGLIKLPEIVKEIREICDSKTSVKFKTIEELYDHLIKVSYSSFSFRKNAKNERLYLIDTQTDDKYSECPKYILTTPWVRLSYHKDLFTEITKKKMDILRLSEKKPIMSSSEYAERCSAFYKAHILAGMNTKEVLSNADDRQYIEFPKSKSLTLNQIAEIEDRTNGYNSKDMYNHHPGEDIDRSNWEPRRNNWNLR